jgi:predicted nucleic acid-binding protein
MTTAVADNMTFLDSNIILYALGADEHKRKIARELLLAYPYISTQVINECSHVLCRKQGCSPKETGEHLSAIIMLVNVVDVSLAESRTAWLLAERYGYSHYDSLILATALMIGCDTLYTEDMQHGQVINQQLTLLNPFKV